MIPEWLTPPPHEQRAASFEKWLTDLAWQHAFPLTTDGQFLSIEGERLNDLKQIDEARRLGEKAGDIELMGLATSAGDLADQASAQFAAVEVSLTASDRKLIDQLIPQINQAAEFCGGTPAGYSIEYQPLEEGENISGYWFSKDTHVFE